MSEEIHAALKREGGANVPVMVKDLTVYVKEDDAWVQYIISPEERRQFLAGNSDRLTLRSPR